MKFLHAADIHLDSPLEGLERYEGAPVEIIRGATRRALENLVQLAILERVDFVIIAGDLYDGDWRDFNTGMFFVRQMGLLQDAGIRCYLIAGNHDAASTMTRKLRLPTNPEGDSMMLSHDRSETRRLDQFGVAIHGRSFANQAEINNLVPDYPAPIPHHFNLGILHTSLSGSETHDTYAPCTQNDLRAKGYDYWALGHIHKRSLLPQEGSPFETPLALYSGNIQGRHIRETGPRGCFLVTVDSRHRVEVQFRPLDVFRWEVCVVPCAGYSTTDDVLERFRQELRSLLAQHENVPLGIRVILDGASPAHAKLVGHRSTVTAEIRMTATNISDGRAWIEQVKIATNEPVERQTAMNNEGPLGELDRLFDQLSSDDDSVGQLVEELKDLAKKLPAELMHPPDGLLLENPEWVRNLVKEVRPMLMERLKQ